MRLQAGWLAPAEAVFVLCMSVAWTEVAAWLSDI